MSTKNSDPEALLWTAEGGGAVRCSLCAHRCLIKPGRSGVCRVRRNEAGELRTLVGHRLIASHVDPIEKKPLFHFLPGSRSLSVATVGCNFRCSFCQNWQISQHVRESGSIPGEFVAPETTVSQAVRSGCASISFTYTEPTIYFETCYAVGTKGRAAGLKNVFVTNGYMTGEAVAMARDFLDAANVDLKCFRDRSYRRKCGASLQGVLDGIKALHDAGIWLEVTTLVVPGFNDDPEELRDIVRFLAELSPDIPWHISRYHPDYKTLSTPATPMDTLRRAYAIGREGGLRFVYLGNVPGDDSESTFCPGCGAALIRRSGFLLDSISIDSDRCGNCGEPVPGIWDAAPVSSTLPP